MRFAGQGLHADIIAFEESVALLAGLEVNAEFRVNNIADHERPVSRRILKDAG